jgi:hypothetical protein
MKQNLEAVVSLRATDIVNDIITYVVTGEIKSITFLHGLSTHRSAQLNGTEPVCTHFLYCTWLELPSSEYT